MTTLAITNGFEKLADPVLGSRADDILDAVSKNPAYFPAPTPSVEDMSAIIRNFSDALIECRNGDRLKIAIKNQKRQELLIALHLWSAYVLFRAAGDPVIASASNFTIRKQNSKKPPIKKPENFAVTVGLNPFTLSASVNKTHGANGYIFQYATDEMMAQDNWQAQPSSRTNCIIEGLESGVIYNCRVLAVGPRKQISYSDTVRCRVA